MLRGVFFLQPLAVEVVGLHVECVLSSDRFEVRSGILGDGSLVEASAHCSGGVSAGTDMVAPVDYASTRGLQGAYPSQLQVLYDLFHGAGLQYGPGYRALGEAWSGHNTAVSRLRSRAMLQGVEVHPGDLDGALQLAATASAFEAGGEDSETRLPFAVDDTLLQAASGALWAVSAF